MTKRNSGVFLPAAIDAWGGIDNWISGNRDALKVRGRRYKTYYDVSFPATVCHWVMVRMARDGRLSVEQANALLWKVAQRYSGAPTRTYETRKIHGMGRLVINEYGNASASLWLIAARKASESATDEAQRIDAPHSDMQTRMLWRDGKYTELKPCRWCDEPVQFREHWKAFDGSVRCNRRDCRRMEYLQHKPQSKGGIDLTPRQRQAVNGEAWNTVKTINYLALVAKEQKRGRKSNHDVR
jgi:hypothetical protein